MGFKRWDIPSRVIFMAVKRNLLTLLCFLWLACDDGTSRYMAPSNAAVEASNRNENGSGDAVGGTGNQVNQPNDDLLRQNPNPPGSVLLVSYEEIVKPVIDSACVNCHNDNNQAQAGNLSLASYSQLRAAYGAALVARINNNDNPMPPGAPQEVRADIARLLTNWETQNFPERASGSTEIDPEDIAE